MKGHELDEALKDWTGGWSLVDRDVSLVFVRAVDGRFLPQYIQLLFRQRTSSGCGASRARGSGCSVESKSISDYGRQSDGHRRRAP